MGGTYMKRITSLLLCCFLLAGMLAVSAFAASNIEKIEVTIDEPAVGNAPQYNCRVITEGCAVYKFEPVMWFDKTESRYLTYGDYFQEGHEYTVQIWVAAKTGYKFAVDSYGNIQTTGKINDHTATVYTAYEQDPEEVVELYYDFGTLVSIHTCTPWPVERVEPTCTENGHEKYYQCSGCGMCFSDTRGEVPVDVSTWGIIPALEHTPSGWRVTQVYHYMVCTACGELLGEEDHMGGTASCVEQAQCTICGSYYGELDSDHRWGPGFDYKDSWGHAWICADCRCHSTVVPHNPGPEATETDPQVCRDCGYIIAPVKDHIHSLTKVSETPATCTQEGNIAYYVCSGCSERFTDAAAQNRIPDSVSVTVGALGHITSDEMEFDADFHWRTCTQCGEVLIETRMLHKMENGVCTTCSYTWGAEAAPENTLPSESTELEEDTPHPDGNDQEDDNREKQPPISMLTAVLIGVVSFSAAITATVIILKKKI